jgi:hypothetical protein
MSATPTTALGFQNFFQATLTSDITATSTDIPMDNIPNSSQGFLVIDPDSTSAREVIFYTSKTALKVVAPSVADGRGQDDTTASAHNQGTTVIMAPVAGMFEALQSGAAIANASITASKLATGALVASVATSQTTSLTTYGVLATTGPTVSTTIGANGMALVIVKCGMSNNANGSGAVAAVSVSGATTVAASDANSLALVNTSGTNSFTMEASSAILFTSLNAGTNTFSVQYRAAGGGTATFYNRILTVIPL